MTTLPIAITAAPASRTFPRFGGPVVALAMAVLAIPAAILTCRKTQRFLLAVVLLNISLRLEQHLFLREYARDLGSLGGLQVSMGNIALVCLWIAWLVKLAIGS